MKTRRRNALALLVVAALVLASCGRGSEDRLATRAASPAWLERLDAATYRPSLVAPTQEELVLLGLPRSSPAADGIRAAERRLESGEWGPEMVLPGSSDVSDGQAVVTASSATVVAGLACPERDVEGCFGAGASVRTWRRVDEGRWGRGPIIDVPSEVPGNVTYGLGEFDGEALIVLQSERGDLGAWVLEPDAAEPRAVTLPSTGDTCLSEAAAVSHRALGPPHELDGVVGVDRAELPGTGYEVAVARGSGGKPAVVGRVELVGPGTKACTSAGASYLTVDGLALADADGLEVLTGATLPGDAEPAVVEGSGGRLYAGRAPGADSVPLLGVDVEGRAFAGTVDLGAERQVASGLLTPGGTAFLIIDRQHLLEGDERRSGNDRVEREDEVTYRIETVELAPVE